MPKAVPVKPEPAEAVRFSAPCNIGPPLPGAAAGGVIEVAGPTPNAGRYVIAKVDADWMSITERVIEDEPRPVGVTVALVKGDAA